MWRFLMSDLDNRVVIDSISANIINENSQDMAILVGVFPTKIAISSWSFSL